MKLRRRIKTGAVLGGAALVLSLIAGCGGGGGSASTSSTAQAATMTGTVAVGSAVANATVTVFGANGASATVTADGSGGYSVSLAGLTAPYVVVATDPSGVNATLVSVLASVPAGSTSVVTNVTTLTSAVAALMTASGNPLDLATGGNFSANVTADAINTAVSKLNAALSTILAANGVSPGNFDPIGTPFAPNQTGIDAVIDDIALVTSASGGVQLMSVGDTSSGIPLKRGASIGGPLSAPPAHGAYLAPLMAQLAQCLAGTTSACGQAIDAGYLDYGYTSFSSVHPSLMASGTKLGTPQTLRFFTSDGVEKALVKLRYTSASGVPSSTVTVVQKTSSGTWDIVGNQQPFDVSIRSFLAKRTYLDSATAPFDRYESGIEIRVPAGANGTPNPVTLGSVGVTGPGINGTAFLVPRSGSGNTLLALTSTALMLPPTTATTTNSNTTLYRWSWQAAPGASGAFSPDTGSLGFYTPASISIATVPNFATYTVTFYDTSGHPLASSFPVMNMSPAVPAVAGNGVPWQTLSSDTIANVLTPGGALAGTQASLPVAWSNLVGGVPVAPVVTGAAVQAVSGGLLHLSNVEGFSTMPKNFALSGQYSTAVVAGVDQNGTQQCVSICSYPALQTGGWRLAELMWSMDDVLFYNIWKYND
jgi:hypothetical protein